MSDTEEKKYKRSEAVIAAGAVYEALHLLKVGSVDRGDIMEVAEDAFEEIKIVTDYFKQE